MNSIETLLHQILQLVETQHTYLPRKRTHLRQQIIDGTPRIKDRYLKCLLDNDLLGYSRHGDKY